MATKLDIGTWVRGRKGTERGIVKAKKGQNAHVLWMQNDRAKPCSVRSLKVCPPPRALVLEGSLDSKLESTRSEENVLRTWLGSQNVPLAYKNIHTIEDVHVIGRAIGSNKPLFVHVSCHGDHDPQDGAYIVFSPLSGKESRIYLSDPETVHVFCDAFEGMPILFSACLLGRYQDDLRKFQDAAKLGKIAAFTRVVYDSECMLFELLIYQGMLVQANPFETAVNNAEKALREVGIKGIPGQGFVRVF